MARDSPPPSASQLRTLYLRSSSCLSEDTDCDPSDRTSRSIRRPPPGWPCPGVPGQKQQLRPQVPAHGWAGPTPPKDRMLQPATGKRTRRGRHSPSSKAGQTTSPWVTPARSPDSVSISSAHGDNQPLTTSLRTSCCIEGAHVWDVPAWIPPPPVRFHPEDAINF